MLVLRSIPYAMLLAALALPSVSSPGEELEYQVKAAMMYNFTRFVEWPQMSWKNEQQPMIVGVLGSSPMGTALEEALRGKRHAEHDIRVRHLHSIQEVEMCQMLFVSRSEKKNLAQILRASQSASVLTVSDIEGFARMGGIIEFVVDNDRIRFEIDAPAASKASLIISSKLLSIAAGGGRAE